MLDDASKERTDRSVDFDDSGLFVKGVEKRALLAFKEGEAQPTRPPNSVGNASASLYGCFCCFYNCCCCCFPSRVIGPLCGDKFCCPHAVQCEIRMRRDRWLGILHFICLLAHASMAGATFSVGFGKDMEVEIFRVKPEWNSTGANGYRYTVERELDLRIDVVTSLFFAISASFHFVWSLSSIWFPSVWKYYLDLIDNCFVWTRYVEYAFSASLMLVAIGMITGLRDFNSMFGVFALSFSTMLSGIVTEMKSIKKNPDQWVGDPAPVSWDKFDRYAFWKKFKSYTWRIFPHFAGWVPYLAAWFIVLRNFFEQIEDLPDGVEIPWFVPVAIYGTAVTFSSFAFVQLRYQWTAPKHYWRSEIVFTLLSLTAKMYLGLILFWNVILADSFEEAITPTSNFGHIGFNQTDFVFNQTGPGSDQTDFVVNQTYLGVNLTDPSINQTQP